MATYHNIRVDQPQPNDLVGNPVRISGLGTGFEGDVRARVIDANGAVLGEGPVQAGGMGTLAAFQMQLPLDRTPATVAGTVQVYAPSPRGEPGDEFAGMVAVPVLLGPAVGSAAGDFSVYQVQQGDTLTKIAERFLNDGQRWKDIHAVNRDQLGNNPDLIHPGQLLRIPQ